MIKQRQQFSLRHFAFLSHCLSPPKTSNTRMESILRVSYNPKVPSGLTLIPTKTLYPTLLNDPLFFSTSNKLCPGVKRLVMVSAKKNQKSDKKYTTGDFKPVEDDSELFFPQAVLLKEKKVQEDGKLLPEFADAEERELFEYLNLQRESDTNVKQMRHYEVVYLIHEKHVEEVGKVNEKVEEFLREKKGTVWRFEDWGLRKLAYKIQKATRAHYILTNFELEAKYINDFKSMLDKDERVIRHLVMKRDEAITEVMPPPPEFHTLCGDMDDDEEMDDEDDDLDYDDAEDYEDDEEFLEIEGEMDDYGDEGDDGIILVDGEEDDGKNGNNSPSVNKSVGRKLRAKAGVR